MLLAALACAPESWPALGPATLPHREAAGPCDPHPTEPPDCDPGFGWQNECATDHDCGDDAGGTCVSYSAGYRRCYCVYDGCGSDRDCDGVCACAADEPGVRAVNGCVPAECRLDEDCAPGRCQPTPAVRCGPVGRTVLLPVGGWYCSTPADDCNSDDDCAELPYGRCEYSYVQHRFACGTEYSAGRCP